MANKDERFGVYYGELVEIKCGNEDDMIFHDFTERYASNKLFDSLFECCVLDIFLDVEDDERYSSTLLIGTHDHTDFKKLLLVIGKLRPYEFSEVTDGNYRVWFD